MISKTGIKYATAWLVLTILTGVILGGLNLPTYWRLASRSASADGVVVEALPEMHRMVRYRYVVEGRKYDGLAHSYPPNPPFEQLVEGTTLTVYYDPQKPDRSVLGSPSELLKNETIPVTIAAILFPTLTLLAWRYILLPGYRRFMS
jgi:uncharacterized protein DUF3592